MNPGCTDLVAWGRGGGGRAVFPFKNCYSAHFIWYFVSPPLTTTHLQSASLNANSSFRKKKKKEMLWKHCNNTGMTFFKGGTFKI